MEEKDIEVLQSKVELLVAYGQSIGLEVDPQFDEDVLEEFSGVEVYVTLKKKEK